MTVHNHGTEDGPGLACPESRINGELKGKCMSDNQVIPEAAVEAAANALWLGGTKEPHRLRQLRAALEAAAPHMLAWAWEAGFGKGDEFARWLGGVDSYKPDFTNPYKPTP